MKNRNVKRRTSIGGKNDNDNNNNSGGGGDGSGVDIGTYTPHTVESWNEEEENKLKSIDA